MLTYEKIIEKLSSSSLNQTSKLRSVLKLSSAIVDLVKNQLTKTEYLDDKELTRTIKYFPVTIRKSGTPEDAISTLGGVSIKALDNNYELVDKPSNYCIGEMVDWNSPTGGFLIQGCVSMAYYLSEHFKGKI